MKAGTWLLASAAGLVFGAVGLAGCFLVSNLDRFEEADEVDGGDAGEAGVDDPNAPSTLSLTMIDMGFHFQQLIEFRVVDDQNRIRSRGFIQPLDEAGTVKITVTIPKAIPVENAPYRLDFFGDMNDSGAYDGIGDLLKDDHAWRIEPLSDFPEGSQTHVANLVQVAFLHNGGVTDIDQWPSGSGKKKPPSATGLGARVSFDASSLAAHRGKLLQVRVAETLTGHVVGLYRNPKIPGKDFAAYMPGTLDPGVDYFVEIYVDANGDGAYQSPAELSADSDLGWRIPLTATPTTPDGGPEEPLGIDYAFNAVKDPNPNNLDVGPP